MLLQVAVSSYSAIPALGAPAGVVTSVARRYRELIDGVHAIAPIEAAVVGEEAYVGGVLAHRAWPYGRGTPRTAWPAESGALEWFLDGVGEDDWF